MAIRRCLWSAYRTAPDQLLAAGTFHRQCYGVAGGELGWTYRTNEIRSINPIFGQATPIFSTGPLTAATQTEGRLAPGDVVLIRGANLADGQKSSTSALETSLAGASLAIGTTLAQLLYVDSTQIIGLVPSGVVPTSQPRVRSLPRPECGRFIFVNDHLLHQSGDPDDGWIGTRSGCHLSVEWNCG